MESIWKQLIFCIAIFIATLCLFYPGVTGTFLLDDYGTLSALGDLNTINSPEKLWQYVFSGFTGPGGRPVALLTFAANAQTWPADPYPFILTNIFIHALNSLLLYLFVVKLFSAAGKNTQREVYVFAWMVSLFWALHPFQVSSVLYIVQRMTLLAATFSFIVFIAYLYGRSALLAGRIGKAFLLLTLMTFAAAFAFYSKENAVLLPIQLLTIEIFLKHSGGVQTNFWHRSLIRFCLLPAVLIVVAYLAKILVLHIWQYWQTGVDASYGRTYTLFERLLTQQRILGDYLSAIVLPRMQSAGVFFDGYAVSKTLFSPLSTFIWFLFHTAAIALAWLGRRRWPIVFLGVWWFYASHLMESTVVMLELKFEHRNYLASIGLLILLVFGINHIKSQKRRILASAGIVLIYAFFLYMSANLWGDPLKSALIWANKNPNSVRALDHAATIYLQREGATEKTKQFLKQGIALSKKPTSELKYIVTFCDTFNDEPPNWQGLAERLKTEPRDWGLYTVLERLLNSAVNKTCDLTGLDNFRMLFAAYRANPAYKGTPSLHLMDDLEIKAALFYGNHELARTIDAGLRHSKVPLAFIMNRALFFASYGHLEHAVEILAEGISKAEARKSESEYTLKNAREMLGLMNQDLPPEKRATPDGK
jgi:hypothetical protein